MKIQYYSMLTLLTLSILLIFPAAALTTNEMIKELNTPENIQMISKALDDPALLNSYGVSATIQEITKKNKFIIIIDGSTFYFTKYQGITTECTSDCLLDAIAFKKKYIDFIYNNQADLKMAASGTLSWWAKTTLSVKLIATYLNF